MADDLIRIEPVSDVAGVHRALGVFRQIWGPGASSDVDVYIAVIRHGGYMSVAHADGRAVGAAFGFISAGGTGLHSHVTGIVPSHMGSGLGRRLKDHQRAWAAERGIDTITWTFDPLIRRNAWFNLVRLGTEVATYHVNYYGVIDDAINGLDETDRLEVRWSVASATPTDPIPRDSIRTGYHELIATPPDIEALRREDLSAARIWRTTMRDQLAHRLATGSRIVGLTPEGDYVLEPAGDPITGPAAIPAPPSSPQGTP